MRAGGAWAEGAVAGPPPWPWGTLLLVVLIVLPLAAVGHHVPDTDLFYHLASGRWMVEEGRVLSRETFSFTRQGEPWTYHSWLFGLLAYLVHAAGGFPALNALRAVLVVTTMGLVFAACWRRSRSRLVAFSVTLLAFALYAPRAPSLRPHLFSYLFLALAVLLLERLWRRPGALDPWLPLLCVPWAALHGVEYPVLFVLVGAYGAAALASRWRMPVRAALGDRDLRRWPLLGLACLAGFLLNPFGWRILSTPWGLDREVVSRIGELQPITLAHLLTLYPLLTIPAEAYLTIGAAAVLVAAPSWVRRRDLPAILAVSAMTVLAARGFRFASELAVVAAGFVAGGLADRWREARPERRWLGPVALLALAGCLGGAVVRTAHQGWVAGQYRPISRTLYPDGPAAFLRAHGLAGNVFNDPGLGGYVTWALFPGVRVFMDMRVPGLFDARIAWLSQGVARGQEGMTLEALQGRWPVDFVLARREWALTGQLRRGQTPGYVLAYADGPHVLFVAREKPGPRAEALALRHLDIEDPSLAYVAGLAEGPAREGLRGELRRLREVWDGNRLAHETELALLLAERRWAEARDRAELLIAGDRAWLYPRYAAGLALRQLGQDLAALDRLRGLLALDPAFSGAAPALAEAALRLGRARAARDVMEGYLVARRYFLTAAEYALLGNARYQVGARAAATEAFERALLLAPESHPERATIEANLGTAYVDDGRAAPGATLLESALRRRAPFPEAEYNLARAWLRLGRREEARRALARLAADEGAPAALRQRARDRLAAP